MASCTTELELEVAVATPVDFNGIYAGTFDCVGEETDDNGEAMMEQTLNEEFEFDVVTLAGTITKNIDDTYQFVFEFEVDEEGTSSCDVTLEKQ